MDTSKRKPDLLSASRSVQDRGQRILASLEQGGKPVTLARRAASRQLDSWIVGVSSVVVVLAAFAWVMHDSSVAPAPKRITWASARPAQADQAAPPAGGMAQQQASQAAAIVNEAPEHHAAYGAPTAASVSTTSSASTTASGPAIEPGPIAARASAVTEHSKASAGRTNASAAPAASAVNVASRAAGAAGPSVSAARNASPAPATSADTDVALLTALVAHSGRPATVTPERSRDVVERHDGDSSETLLARCKQLGLIEGMLCRSRICSGRWESDAACRAPDHERPLPAY